MGPVFTAMDVSRCCLFMCFLFAAISAQLVMLDAEEHCEGEPQGSSNPQKCLLQSSSIISRPTPSPASVATPLVMSATSQASATLRTSLTDLQEELARAREPRRQSWSFPPGPAPEALGPLNRNQALLEDELAASPNPGLIKSNIEKEERKKALLASADVHFTTHGCHCLGNWTYEGKEYKSCNKIDADFAHDWPWCKVVKEDEDCQNFEGDLEDGGRWDFCTMPDELTHTLTMHGCHCSPRWEYKDKYHESCGKTSKGPSWCYVFEGSNLCPEALKTDHHGQHWDYCFRVEEATIVTKNGCHCMPEFFLDEKKISGCSDLDGSGKMKCVVIEDSALCPKAEKHNGTALLIDECIEEEPEAGIEAPEKATFDCDAGFENFEKGWSNEKKEWCCVSTNKGCEFDCDAGIENALQGWSDLKKKWCCKQENKGCMLFDCTAGVENWQAGWSPDKKKFCCDNFAVACKDDEEVETDAQDNDNLVDEISTETGAQEDEVPQEAQVPPNTYVIPVPMGAPAMAAPRAAERPEEAQVVQQTPEKSDAESWALSRSAALFALGVLM